MSTFVKIISVASLAALAASCATAPKAAPAPAPAVSPSSTAAVKAKKTNEKGEAHEMKCETKGDTRTTTLVSKDGGCELQYVKFGKSGIAASSAKGTEHCAEVQAKIRKNLETAGFKCN